MRSLKLRAGSKSGLNPQSKGLSACKELARNLMKCNNPCWKLKMLALQQRESYPPFQMPSNYTKKFSSIFYEWVMTHIHQLLQLPTRVIDNGDLKHPLWTLGVSIWWWLCKWCEQNDTMCHYIRFWLCLCVYLRWCKEHIWIQTMLDVITLVETQGLGGVSGKECS